jgi:hypothetical protein
MFNEELDEKEQTPETTIELELGDFIKITDEINETLNEQTFFIDYIDDSKLFLINSDTFQTVKVNINPNGTMNDGTISKIAILNRSDEKGYARQHGLLTDTWIDIHFAGEHPTIITGVITNLENDMIEVKTTHGDVIYINFDYKGIPEDLPIKLFEIRDKPESIEKKSLKPLDMPLDMPLDEPLDMTLDRDMQLDEDMPLIEETTSVPFQSVKDRLREFIVSADQIVFGTEELGTITQYIEVSNKYKRFSIESQVTDMLDEFLSEIPNSKRTQKVLNNIHTMIERFKQLRENFSVFDEYGNVEGSFTNKVTYKPLFKYFETFQKNLYWILPVVQNVKKIYNSPDEEAISSDVINEDINEDIHQIMELEHRYKSNDLPNKYSTLYTELNPYLTPFESISDEINVTAEKQVNADLNVIIDNLDDMYSSIFSNNSVRTRRFVIQKYNLGLTKLDTVDVKKNTKRVVLTNNDTMSIKSFITLPEPTIRFSRINLPGTNMLDRANLNTTFLNFWQFLNKKTTVKVINIDNNDIQFNDETFVNNIKNYVLMSDDIVGLNKNEMYAKFIETIIPKTKIIFDLMKKYIVGKLSIVDVVSYLEPFLIYTDSLTYTQYLGITEFIAQQITAFNKNYSERSQVFSKLRSVRNTNLSLCSIISIITKNKSEVFDAYDIDTTSTSLFTNSEILRKLTIKDSLRLYSSALSMQGLSMMFPDEFNGIFKVDNPKPLDETSDECEPIIFAKSYANIEELENDNDKNIYFDKKYDSTKYGLIDSYESKMYELSPDDFIAYLTNDLKKKLKIETDVDYLVDTLINGHKKVRDGQYAILFKEYKNTYKDQYDHYIRKNNKWIKTEPPLKDAFTDDTDILCNLQKKCISVADKCESVETDDLSIKNKLIDDIVNEFDEKYKMSKQDLQTSIQNRFNYFLSIMGKLTKIETDNLLKYNNQKYRLGYLEEIDNPQIISPYFKIRDLILSQTDFTKKQQDIIRFKTMYTREAINDETVHWLYCIATDVKLLPTFKYDLACVFMTKRDEYSVYIELLKSQIGKLSDDGDQWVDKHSGWPITKIDFDVEEGYDEGFKVSTRAKLEEEIGDRIITNKVIKFDTPETKMISNVVNALSHNMGINVEAQKEFIINCVMSSMNNVGDETDYNVRVKEASNKNRTLPPYKDYRNTYLLFATLGMLLISIQTSVPSIRTKTTFPGCVKSFVGYPFEGSGDLSSIVYLSCVVDQVRKARSEPWNVLARIKKEVIADKIKKFIDDVLLSIPDVKRKINEKTEYLLINPELEIPEIYNVLHWTNFLPPLAPIKIHNPANITDDFQKQLMKNMQIGSRDQLGKLLIIESKIILFSLALQEKIQEVVKTKDYLLSKANNEPFLENACCDSKSGQTTIQYFENENNNIKEYNRIVEQLSNILADVTSISKAGMFFSNINTKNVYPPISQTFDERIIYMAFIKFCKFRTLNPIPSDMLPLCSEKPTINANDSLSEIIRKLKSDGIEYSNETFLRLLQIVARNNIVDIDIGSPCISSITRILGVLESIKRVPKDFIDKMNDALETFSIATDDISDETEKLNNYLITQNDVMRKQITDFIIKNKSPDMDRKSINKVTSFLDTFASWSGDNSKRNEDKKISNDNMYNVVNYFKMFIDNFVDVFPSIILNKVNYSNINVPTYWKLSAFHNKDVKNIVKQYYEKLKIFYDVPELYNILKKVSVTSRDIVLLAKSTPCFTTINYKGQEFVPVFDERTSKYLFEYYFLSVLSNYTELTNESDMIVTSIPRQYVVEDIFSVESVEESVTRVDINIDPRNVTDNIILTGNKKQLKHKVAHVLVTFLNIMNSHKETTDLSYEDVLDRVFKLKEREKDNITDRLKGLTEEERDADTILKINKLGVWNKGLQKGLTSYVADTYDDERELRDKFGALEKKLMKNNKDVNEGNRDTLLEELAEQEDNDRDIEDDAYNIGGYNDDYGDGNYDGDEVGEDYD